MTFVLSPLLALMRALYQFFAAASSSAGVGVALLAATMAALCAPLQRYGATVERRVAARRATVALEERALPANLRGEARFNETEKIYQKHGYHPAQQMLGGAQFLFQLPFLLAAFLLFAQERAAGGGFAFVKDLARPDAALQIGGFAINALPLCLLALCFVSAAALYGKGQGGERRRFLALSAVLVVLVYPLPAALLLYWLAMSACAAAIALCWRRLGGDAK